jgi:RNA polymerase sigma-70 factor (ECF subfamily)
MSESTDVALWERVVDGDGDAFAELFARHVNAVANYAFRRTTNWSTAEDVTSLVFLEAWRQRRRVRFHQETILPWLIGVAHNVVRNMWRSSLRHRRALLRIRVEVADTPEDDVAGRVDDERRMAQVRQLIDRLPPADRTMIELCAWARLSYAEASVALGVPVGTVRSRLSRARARLRELEAEALAEPWQSPHALAREEKQ